MLFSGLVQNKSNQIHKISQQNDSILELHTST